MAKKTDKAKAGKKKSHKQASNKHGAEHLADTKFKPGQSGNPGGRPKGTSLTSLIRKALTEKDKDGKTNGEVLIQQAVKYAKKGNFNFFKEIINRVDGKVPDKIEGNIELKGNVAITDLDDEALARAIARLGKGETSADGKG